MFRHCVEDVIREGRGGKETGILLSGGLDSNAVAAYAAPYLAARGKKLYSFTAVPEEKERARIQDSTLWRMREAVWNWCGDFTGIWNRSIW